MASARIVICDDHQLIRQLIGDVLREDGHEVRETATVAEALDELALGAVDVLVLDLHLRGASGTEVLEHVRADSMLAATPVILLSGDFDGRSDDWARRYGADAVLPKPFDPDVLSETVRELLARDTRS